MKLRRYQVEVGLVVDKETVQAHQRRFFTERGAEKWCKRWIDAMKASGMNLTKTETEGDPMSAVTLGFAQREPQQ